VVAEAPALVHRAEAAVLHTALRAEVLHRAEALHTAHRAEAAAQALAVLQEVVVEATQHLQDLQVDPEAGLKPASSPLGIETKTTVILESQLPNYNTENNL
jgi:hypothetical protein